MTLPRRDRVLVVGDDPVTSRLAREALEQSGFQVSESNYGPEASGLFTSWLPDLVLLDMAGAGDGALALCRQIRGGASGADTPLLMMPPLEDSESIDRAYQAGATDFVTKPVQWQVLGHRVRYTIRAGRTVQELGDSRTNYLMLFQTNPHPMWVFDLESLRFLDVNNAAVDNYGYCRQEFLGMTIADIRPPEDVAKLCGKVAVVSEGFENAGLWRHIKKDGTIIDVEITAHSLEFAGRKAQVVLANDVTERLRSARALSQSEEKYRTLCDGVSDVLYAIGPDRTFLTLNAAFEAVTGWPRQAWIGRDFLPLIYHEDHDRAMALFSQGLQGVSLSPFELRLVGRYGEVVTIEVSLTVQRQNGEVTSLQGIARDLTERKRTQLELSRVDRALRTVSQCTRAAVYASSERGLLEEICRSVVERGYCFAWVGYAAHDRSKTVVPVAKAGLDDGYLDEIELSWHESGNGGAAGTAILTGQVRIFRESGADDDLYPWRAAARRHGFHSTIGLPLSGAGAAFGALVIHASDPGAFDEAEVELLKELASTISYGITALRMRQEHDKAEAELKMSQTRLKEALHLAKLASWSWNGTGEVVWSDEVATILELAQGERPSSFAGQARFFAPESFVLFEQAVQRALDAGEEFRLELEARTAAGNRRWLMARGARLTERGTGAAIGVHGTWQDITERKLAQLKEEQLRRRLLAMWNIGRMVDASFTSLNETVLLETIAITGSCFGFFGHLNDDESLVTTHAWSDETMPGCDMANKTVVFSVGEGGLWAEAIRRRSVIIVNDYQCGDSPGKKGLPAGHLTLTRIMVVPIFRQGRIVALSAVANKETDYTLEDAEQLAAFLKNVQILLEKRKAEESLALLSQAVEQSPVSIVITDTEGTIQFVNPKFTQLSGFERDEVLGRDLGFLDSGTPPGEQYQKMWEVVCAGGTWHGELVSRKKSGEVFREAAVVSPVKNTEGAVTHYLAFKEDITSQKRLEEQLWHAQKMEAVGTLAGGIAHDFNNILTSVLGYCSVMEKKIAQGDPLRNYLAKVVGAADRAASLTRGLLTYSRKEPARTRPIDINSLLVQAEQLLSRLLSEDIELSICPGPTQLSVLADPVQLEQVVMNLVSNARDALPQGGVITVASHQLTVQRDTTVASGGLMAGNYAVITVTDNGCGMDAATVDRIFEPFFTTKEVGKGTGLGLSISYGIVGQHGGSIDVESSLGGGTTFTIYIPLAERVEEGAVAVSPSVPLLPGAETILLVEDDDGIRDVFAEVLGDSGYRVITAADGEEALDRFRRQGEEIRLVILDVIMPKKNGVAVYEELKTGRPGLKALFISGYSADMLNERVMLGNQNVLLVPKPITPDLLLCKVREVLDAPDPALA